MATVTDPNVDAVSTSNATSYGNTEFAPDLAFTPAVNDLIVVAVSTSGSIEPTAAGAITDDQGGTYHKAITALRGTSLNSVYLFVRNQAVSSAVLHTLTFTCTGDAATGACAIPLQVAGMSRYGSSAVRQTDPHNDGGAGGTPAPEFPAACLTGNVTIGVIGNASNPAGLTPPTSWTEAGDTGIGTPNQGIEVVYRNSGFTGTVITWGSSSATAWGAVILELDTSAADAVFPRKPVIVNVAMPQSYTW